MKTSSSLSYFRRSTSAAPLAVFRIFFGLLMFISILRFAVNGWIEKLYIEPDLFFSYLGFGWIQPLGNWTYLIFVMCGLSSIFIAMGYKYRLSILMFFLSFTYIELMDKTTYLNHYYFITVLSFLMIFLPAHVYFSFDAYKDPQLRSQLVPNWTIDSLKLLVGIVYFYAGLAKLNSDWLLHAMPLQIWLPAKYSIPILGDLFQNEWVHYTFAWSGALYDLTIPFLLLITKTRRFAFLLVVIFHVLTRVLFPIGMFPYIMIASTLIFFEAGLHKKILALIAKWFRFSKEIFDNSKSFSYSKKWQKKASISIISLFFILQLLVPFRYLLYPGELFWHEEGFRFSWRVMLIEKAGYANFSVVDPENDTQFYVDNTRFLTRFQEKQMATQPDFILEYAHFLEDYYQQKGINDPQIYVESFAALNGRKSRPFADPAIDLTTIKRSLKHRTWILPLNEEIKGL